MTEKNTEFCSKGALFDLLNNPDVKLDLMFIGSLIMDLVSGMHFLHNSTQLAVHGNLRTSNCLVTRYVIKMCKDSFDNIFNKPEFL